jgi:DNA-binding beta-propeller fold protein YncE
MKNRMRLYPFLFISLLIISACGSDNTNPSPAGPGAGAGLPPGAGAGSPPVQWGSQGSGNGQFNNPGGAAVDSAGNIYVADTGNSRIQKFDSNGNYLTKWGGTFSPPPPSVPGGTSQPYVPVNGQFLGPSGVAVDSAGNVYVADTGNNRIQEFDSNGNYLAQWGGFNQPGGVAVDSAGNVYVADTRNNRIEEFLFSIGN